MNNLNFYFNFQQLRFSRNKLLRVMLRRDYTIRRISAPGKLEVHLTEVEEDVCQLLQDCTKDLHENKAILTTCRIAGGWVRDKLLGSQSNDMDVAMSDIMGLAFAEHLSRFAHSKGIQLGTITKIEQNPDQSKHLETATLKIFGLDIDLVNLRSEEYAIGSRIPTGVAFGTPLEDALRRDITINALFYNVDTRIVEDYTEKGLADLREGIIRTPMPPRDTLLDDPLRVLRCIRFASRFGFELVPELQAAIKDPNVQEALILGVARERVGDEVSKMIKGGSPLHSAQLIHELSLYHSIFSVLAPEAKATVPDIVLKLSPNNALAAVSILDSLLSLSGSPSLLLQPHSAMLSAIVDEPSSKARLFLAALLIPYIDLTYKDSKNKTHPVVTSAIRDSLKLGTQNHFLDGIPTLFSATLLIKRYMGEHSNHPHDRVKLGLFLRNRLVHNPITGNHWATSILFSLVTELVPLYDISKESLDVKSASNVIACYNSLVDTIITFDLQNHVGSKPLLNGHEVSLVFGSGTKYGPWIGKALEDVVEWQLGHPSGVKDDCIQWLKEKGVDFYTSGGTEKSILPSKRIRTK